MTHNEKLAEAYKAGLKRGLQLVSEDRYLGAGYVGEHDAFHIAQQIVYANEKEIEGVIKRDLQPVLAACATNKRAKLSGIVKSMIAGCKGIHKDYKNTELVNGMRCGENILSALLGLINTQEDNLRNPRELFGFTREFQNYLENIADDILDEYKESAQKIQQIRQNVNTL